jgi:phage-related protein
MDAARGSQRRGSKASLLGRPSKEDFRAFPTPVQKDLGVALFVVQLGGMPPCAKPWHGQGAGIYELVDEYAGGAHRCVFIVRFPEAIYVLHAFQKKSRRGRKTPRPMLRSSKRD